MLVSRIGTPTRSLSSSLSTRAGRSCPPPAGVPATSSISRCGRHAAPAVAASVILLALVLLFRASCLGAPMIREGRLERLYNDKSLDEPAGNQEGQSGNQS